MLFNKIVLLRIYNHKLLKKMLITMESLVNIVLNFHKFDILTLKQINMKKLLPLFYRRCF